jgi:hypothetical protein
VTRSFTQPAPQLSNQYTDDRVLRSYLARTLSSSVLRQIEPQLTEMGGLAGGPLYGFQLDDRLNFPLHTPFDAWGNRIDRVDVSPLWRAAEQLAARNGLIAIPYERANGAWSRVHQFALVYLFTASTDVYNCPLAMTDGAACALSISGNKTLAQRALPHLTARDPAQFWTSGQWMTESTGGSDVGLSETIARQQSDGSWRLYGRKWFFLAGSVIFVLSSALCGGAGEITFLGLDGMSQLILFRAFQGFGAGIMMGLIFTIIGDIFSPAERGHYHDRRYYPVHVLAAEQVGDPPEQAGAEECGAQHGGVQQRKFAGTQVPLQRDQRRGDPDDEQVVGVGEEPHPRHQHRPQVEPAQRRLIERGD